MTQKVLVVGGFGLVGSELYRQLKRQGFEVYRSHHRRIPYSNGKRVHINLCNETTFGMALADVKPDIVYLCAAYTNVDECETDPIAFEVNVKGTLRFIEECHRRGIRVVFYSSSYVFDGEAPYPYTEDDYPRPLNKYGLWKLEAEGYVLSKPNGMVIRTVGVFGEEGKNFKARILNLSDADTVYIPDNQYVTPIHAKDLAKYSVQVEQTGYNGIINIAGLADTTKYYWAKMIRVHAKKSTYNIFPTSEPNQKACRPKNGTLTILKLISTIPDYPKTTYPEFDLTL